MSLFARPLSLSLYGIAARAAAPLAPALLRARARRGKEDEARLAERLGRASAERPKGPLVWLHAVSVGESLSLLPLIERLTIERPDAAALITTSTRTSAELLAQRAPEVIHQYAPVDTPGAVARFLDHWRPDVGVFVESELWPNLILTARRRGVRLALVSARITQKTARGWSRDVGAARALFGAFDLILAQDTASAARIEGLGGRVDGTLNLKLAAPPLGADPEALARLQAAIGERAVILGASTHAPEEALLATAVDAMATKPTPLLILAPRHPERGAEVADALKPGGRCVARRGAGDRISPAVEVYVADTLGEMGLWFRLADVSVMGGSLVGGVGGHNPLEPARLGSPVIVGSDVANFREVYDGLFERGACARADDREALAEVLEALMADPSRRSHMSEAGLAFAEASAGDMDRAWSRLAPLMPPRR